LQRKLTCHKRVSPQPVANNPQFAGTNIGTTILLSRVIQSWQRIHELNGIDISDRTFWGTVYSMAIGVNYGAFSLAFSASLAGMLWRDILGRKHIRVGGLEFARVNLPIIAITMVVGLTVLIGQIYIVRDTSPYNR
jgi:Na+/H+ antiporter NhaD/arsenite permease-like protein